MKLGLSVFSAVLLASSLYAVTPGGVQKKFIALNFDTMFNAPSNVFAHVEALNAVPWLDGIAVSLCDVPVKTLDGKTEMSASTKLMQLNHIWTYECVEDQLPYLSGLVKHPRLKESFLLTWITPAGKENRIGWTDDAAWARFGDNLAVLARLAKKAGLKGLMLDPEEYSGALQYLYTEAEKDISFEECTRLARQRGREVFSRVFKEFPDGVYFFLWTIEHHVRTFTGRAETNPKGISDDMGELLTYFYNGMFDVMPPTVRFVDGAEHYSLTSTKDMYWKGALNQLVGARAFVAPENWAKYRSQLLVGNTHYLDMFSQLANPRSWWYHGPVNGSRLEHFRRNLVQSLQVADEYVWIYGENGRLIDWKCAVTKSQESTDTRRLWEDVIPGMTETMMLAKDPDALFEMRKKEYSARGELENLAKDCKSVPVKYSYSPEGKEFSSKTIHSVKGVIPGEIYEVAQEFRSNAKDRLPTVTVEWRAKGKSVAENGATRLESASGNPADWCWVRKTVTVPEGADELVLNFSAVLKPGESVTPRKTEVFKIEDAYGAFKASVKSCFRPAGKKAGGKWVYDEKKKILSNGNWTLSVQYARGDMTKTKLSVNGAKAPGAGVLDFTDVEKDTGMKVVSINGFARNTAITELIGPDVASTGMDAMRFCYNLRRVALSADLEQLTTSSFAYCTNLVEFLPQTLPAKIKLAGISQFQSCNALVGDFVYEGSDPLPGNMFAGTAIRSLKAPNCTELKRGSLSGCRNLKYLSFAEKKEFANASERNKFFKESRAQAGILFNLIEKNAKGFDNLKAPRDLRVMVNPRPSVKGVKPGELYGVSISCRKMAFTGSDFFRIKWLKEGRQLAWDTERPFGMKGMRENGVWRTGSVLARVPAEADELVLEAGATVKPGETFEFDKVEIFKLGDPLPAWPAECEREKGAK